MNAIARTAHTATINIIGALIVLIALAFGAGFGTLTSTDTPARATTPTDDTCLVCAGTTTTGHNGTLPTRIATQGGIGNN